MRNSLPTGGHDASHGGAHRPPQFDDGAPKEQQQDDSPAKQMIGGDAGFGTPDPRDPDKGRSGRW